MHDFGKRTEICTGLFLHQIFFLSCLFSLCDIVKNNGRFNSKYLKHIADEHLASTIFFFLPQKISSQLKKNVKMTR